MALAETTWTFHIDESGDFDDPCARVVVAGLLIRSGLPGTSPAALRRAIGEAIPFIPWPPHTAHLNVPAYVCLCLAAKDLVSPGHWTRAVRVGRNVRTWLERDRTEETSETVDILASGRRPRYDTVVDLDRHLKRTNRPLYFMANDVRAEVEITLDRVVYLPAPPAWASATDHICRRSAATPSVPAAPFPPFCLSGSPTRAQCQRRSAATPSVPAAPFPPFRSATPQSSKQYSCRKLLQPGAPYSVHSPVVVPALPLTP